MSEIESKEQREHYKDNHLEKWDEDAMPFNLGWYVRLDGLIIDGTFPSVDLRILLRHRVVWRGWLVASCQDGKRPEDLIEWWIEMWNRHVKWIKEKDIDALPQCPVSQEDMVGWYVELDSRRNELDGRMGEVIEYNLHRYTDHRHTPYKVRTFGKHAIGWFEKKEFSAFREQSND